MKSSTRNKSFVSIVIIVTLMTMTLATIMNSQLASAIGPKQERAFEFSPGHLKLSEEQSESARDFAPGQVSDGGSDTPHFTPGHIFQQETETD